MTSTLSSTNQPSEVGQEFLNQNTPLGLALSRLQKRIQENPQQPETPATQPPERGMKQKESLPSAASVGQPKTLLWDEMPLRDNREAQEQLTRLLSQTYASQQTYGDKAAMMEYRDGMFQMVLADYNFRQIHQAFLEHIRESSNLPAPADIYRRIVPPEPKPDWAAYVGLKERSRSGEYLMSDQRAYVAWCEGWAVKQKGDYDAHQAEIQKYQTRMALSEEKA